MQRSPELFVMKLRKSNVVNWDVCCQPKSDDCLGFKRPHYMNGFFLDENDVEPH